MQELQVPTHETEVEIQTVSGQSFHGSLFLVDSPYHQGGFEDLLDALNDERDFLPFGSVDPAAGRCVLGKSHILRVRLLGGAPPDTSLYTGDEHAACTIVLEDGSRLRGLLMVESPPSSSRTVDRLNRAERFVPFASDEAADIVQTRCIVRAF